MVNEAIRTISNYFKRNFKRKKTQNKQFLPLRKFLCTKLLHLLFFIRLLLFVSWFLLVLCFLCYKIFSKKKSNEQTKNCRDSFIYYTTCSDQVIVDSIRLYIRIATSRSFALCTWGLFLSLIDSANGVQFLNVNWLFLSVLHASGYVSVPVIFIVTFKCL